MSAGKSEELCGVRYWAAIYKNRVPRFEVFMYVGVDQKSDTLHWFESRIDGARMSKTMAMITADTEEGQFKPFLLDMRKMTARMDGE